MTLPDVGVLAGLALLDSTSTGTLTIPVVMLLQPRVRFSRVLGYLTAISLFYWGLGLALTTVGTRITASPGLRDALESRTAYAVQLAIGVGLVAGSYLVDEEAQARRRARRGDRPSLTSRLMGTVLGPRARWDADIALALAAGLIEAAEEHDDRTFVRRHPLFKGLRGAERGRFDPVRNDDGIAAVVLAAYVAVMVAPALLLTTGRAAVGDRLNEALARINAFIEKHSANSLAWVMGILGFLLAADALGTLLE